MKQKILVDLKSRKNPLRDISPQVNLGRVRVVRVPLKFLAGFFVISFFIMSFVFNFAAAPTNKDAKAQTTQTPQQERAALEAQFADLEKQIDDAQSKINDYKKQGTTLQSEINRLNSLISKANLQIKAINLNIKEITQELADTQSKIKTTQSDIGDKKNAISVIIQSIYENERRSNLAMLLSNMKISDLFTEVSNLTSIQDQLSANLKDLVSLQDQLSDQQQTLATEKTDTENLKASQEAQRLAIQQTQTDKANLLKATKGKESEYQKILATTQQTAAQIRNRLFELLGGGEIKFEDAYKLAQYAGQKTGVRPSLILAVLDRESALGQNVGKCKYNQINPRSGLPAMSPKRDVPDFMDITSKLGIDPSSVTVSCANNDGAYGGAMGPAQFIPSTWAAYEDNIATITGSSPASPWKNLDAFVATALYLKDAGAIDSLGYSAKVAAAKYYCGGNWNRYVCTGVYGAGVIAKAQQFEQDIAALLAIADTKKEI